MTTTQQPEALVFADDRPTSTSDDLYQWAIDAEDLIRAQHARIAELEDVADMAIKRIEELEEQLAATVTVDVPMVPHGWKLVPVEPTEKMIIEGGCAQKLKDGHRYIGECAAKTVWSFMLAATPQPPACNQSMQPELATYSAQARNKKGIEQ